MGCGPLGCCRKKKVGPAQGSTAMTELTTPAIDDKCTQSRTNSSNGWLTSTATGPDSDEGLVTHVHYAYQPRTPTKQPFSKHDLPVNSQTVAEAQYKPHFEEIGIQWSGDSTRALNGQSPGEDSRKYKMNVTYPVSPTSDVSLSEQSQTSSTSRIVSDVRSPFLNRTLSVEKPSDIGLKLKESGDGDLSLYNEGPASQAAKTEAAGRLEGELMARVAGTDPLTREGLEALLVTFYEDQTDVLRGYRLDRQQFDQELLRRLRSLKDDMNSGDASPSNLLSDTPSVMPSTSASVDKRVGQMDDDFIEWLGRTRAAGKLSPSKMQQLVQQHLQEVAEFKASMKNELENLREEMQECSRKESKLSNRERRIQVISPVNTIDVDSFVDQERQQAARLRKLRYDERERTNTLLKEKLKRQKQLKERKRSSQALEAAESQ